MSPLAVSKAKVSGTGGANNFPPSPGLLGRWAGQEAGQEL